MNKIITADYFPGKDCDCEARSSYECGCDADWTPTEVYKLREDAKQLSLERDDALSQIAQAEKRAERFCQDRDEAREQLRIAVGLLSTQPQFADKHPEEVLAFVKEGGK